MKLTDILFEKKEMGDLTISSTKIRQSLELDGNVGRAEELLGRPYSFEGVVVHGDERGRTIGFPTANIGIKRRLSPVLGVYSVIIEHNSKPYTGVCNVGRRPTLGGTKIPRELPAWTTPVIILLS